MDQFFFKCDHQMFFRVQDHTFNVTSVTLVSSEVGLKCVTVAEDVFGKIEKLREFFSISLLCNPSFLTLKPRFKDPLFGLSCIKPTYLEKN